MNPQHAKILIIDCGTMTGRQQTELELAKEIVPFFGWESHSGIEGVICGCETSAGARPMSLDWARALRDECKAAGVPFFMKKCKPTDRMLEDLPADLRVREV